MTITLIPTNDAGHHTKERVARGAIPGQSRGLMGGVYGLSIKDAEFNVLPLHSIALQLRAFSLVARLMPTRQFVFDPAFANPYYAREQMVAALGEVPGNVVVMTE